MADRATAGKRRIDVQDIPRHPAGPELNLLLMHVLLIDHTTYYYTSLAGSSIPPAVAGKFVQVRNGDALYIVLSPGELAKYHANIVERFCRDMGIQGSYDSKKEKFTVHDPAWVIIGGGKFAYDTHKKAIKLYDNSMAYGKFDATGMKDMLGALPELSGYTISIEQ